MLNNEFTKGVTATLFSHYSRMADSNNSQEQAIFRVCMETIKGLDSYVCSLGNTSTKAKYLKQLASSWLVRICTQETRIYDGVTEGVPHEYLYRFEEPAQLLINIVVSTLYAYEYSYEKYRDCYNGKPLFLLYLETLRKSYFYEDFITTTELLRRNDFDDGDVTYRNDMVTENIWHGVDSRSPEREYINKYEKPDAAMYRVSGQTKTFTEFDIETFTSVKDAKHRSYTPEAVARRRQREEKAAREAAQLEQKRAQARARQARRRAKQRAS